MIASRLHDLYKVTQQSRKAFRVGKSLTYYKKIDALLENKVRWLDYALLHDSLELTRMVGWVDLCI